MYKLLNNPEFQSRFQYADAVKQAPFWKQNLNFQNEDAETRWI